jgi:hypothetical protein
MKLRKIFVVVLVLLMGAGTVFAQQAAPAQTPDTPKERKNAISLDLFPLFKGFIASDSDSDTFFFNASLNYERLVAPHFSIGAQLDLAPGKVSDNDYMYFGLSAFGRYYPMSENFEKFFLGVGLGFNSESIDISLFDDVTGLTVALKAGYKLITSKNIYIEPSMAYVLSKTSPLMGYASMVPLGWQGGFRFGFVF